MRRGIALLIVFLLSACGGGQITNYQANNYNSYNSGSSVSYMDKYKKQITDKGGYIISNEEFPELYAILLKEGWSGSMSKFGYTGGVSFGAMGTDSEKFFNLQISDSYSGKSNPVLVALLYYFTSNEKLNKARDIIAKGADPNFVGKYSKPLLHKVLNEKNEFTQRLEIINMLLDGGADPSLKSKHGVTPFDIVMSSKSSDAPLFASRLLEAGVDPNTKNKDDVTVLLQLLNRWNRSPNKATLASVLLKAGADPNSKDSKGNTALHVMLDTQSEIPDRMNYVSMLLEAGADPNALSSDGQTAFLTAIKSDIEDKGAVISMFMKHGANPKLVDNFGHTPVHILIGSMAKQEQKVDQQKIIQWIAMLANKDVDLDARNVRGKTPLSYAFFADMQEVQEYLLSMGASDYGIKNDSKGVGTEGGLSVLGMGSGEINNLNMKQCAFILHEYDVEFETLSDIKDVKYPIRLKSPISGISYRHTGNSQKFSILDCRLAVVLVGWAPILHNYDVKEVFHMRMYSPGARVGGGSKISGHSYALAIDAAVFVLENDVELVVNKDWTDRRHSVEPCGDSVFDDSKKQKALRDIACDTGSIDLFSYILTPHYNKAHYDHLHMELTDEFYSFVR